jgi:hypothetical protein
VGAVTSEAVDEVGVMMVVTEAAEAFAAETEEVSVAVIEGASVVVIEELSVAAIEAASVAVIEELSVAAIEAASVAAEEDLKVPRSSGKFLMPCITRC